MWLSPISVWELVLLVEKRRVALDRHVAEWVTQSTSALKEAPLTLEIVLEAARFTLPHDDPADRFLAATVRTLGLTLVTSDARLLASNAVPSCRTGDRRGVATVSAFFDGGSSNQSP